MDGIKVVYISGYSRSGSTILDIILSNHNDIVGTGELCYLFDDGLNDKRLCTCGSKYSKCEFWADYLNRVDIERARYVVREVEKRNNFDKLLDGSFNKKLSEEYAMYQQGLYEYIAGRSGRRIIVDSSKTTRDMAGRCIALHKFTNLDVFMIHLLKNGKSTTKSYLDKGRNWAMEGYVRNDFLQGVRSIVGWKLANSIALKSQSTLGDHYLRAKYEDIMQNPYSKLNELGVFLNLEMSELIDFVKKGSSLKTGHQVGGNRLRLRENIVLKSGVIKPPVLDIFHDLVFEAVAGSLSKRFGY